MKAEEMKKGFKEMVAYIIDTDDKETIDGYSATFEMIAEEYAQHVTEEERKINQTLRDQIKSFERIPDPEGQIKRIQELEARELEFIQSMSNIEEDNMNLRNRIQEQEEEKQIFTRESTQLAKESLGDVRDKSKTINSTTT